ncbi:hypothetical protein HKX48_007132 [Thoreauomyces humboldtii]|nr:hypothetical protein HKX48_007132 [Thoreauomyces humboldtii]
MARYRYPDHHHRTPTLLSNDRVRSLAKTTLGLCVALVVLTSFSFVRRSAPSVDYGPRHRAVEVGTRETRETGRGRQQQRGTEGETNEELSVGGFGVGVLGGSYVEESVDFGDAQMWVIGLEDVESVRIRDEKVVLVATVVKDGASWGGNWMMEDHLDMLAGFDHPRENLDLSFLVSDETEFEWMKVSTRAWLRERNIGTYSQPSHSHLLFPHISILYRRFPIPSSSLTSPVPQFRNDDRDRRSRIARSRNYLLSTTLSPDHAGVLWIDADIHRMPSTLLTKMLGSDRDIVTPLCTRGDDGPSYDLNAWSGTRRSPTVDDLRETRTRMTTGEGRVWVPGPETVMFVEELAKYGQETELVDSVGGTVLFVKADVHRQGVLFPPFYAIGTEWDAVEGWDGIETEGLCYVARTLGYRCWAMPLEIVVHV